MSRTFERVVGCECQILFTVNVYVLRDRTHTRGRDTSQLLYDQTRRMAECRVYDRYAGWTVPHQGKPTRVP